MRLVKDFDAGVKTEHYIVKKCVDNGLPPVIVYDNQTGSDAEYYRIYAKPVKRVSKSKKHFILYI